MPPRTQYDLTHFSAIAGMIGRLNGISTIPIVAGDSMEIDLTTVVRQAPLVRQLTIDARYDVFAFFIPYNAIYSNWHEFIKEGIDETQTLATEGPIAQDDAIHFHGCGTDVYGTVPAWIIHGYNMIWNRWFRVPNISAELPLDQLPTTQDQRRFGYEVPLMPSYLTPMDTVNSDYDSADRELTISGSMDLVDLAKQKARMRTEIQRAWFTQRYAEIMQSEFGGAIGAYAEETYRPELLYVGRNWLSGYDVHGADDVSLGHFVGRSEGVFNHRIPRRYFPEHGTLWILNVLRYPTLVSGHNHYLVCNPNPSYKELAGDPTLIAQEEPIELQEKDFAKDQSTTSMGLYPYAQWYRTHPSHIHRDFERLDGLPIMEANEVDGTSKAERTYFQSRLYNDLYRTTGLRHYHVISKVNVNALRVIPPVGTTLNAGTK